MVRKRKHFMLSIIAVPIFIYFVKRASFTEQHSIYHGLSSLLLFPFASFLYPRCHPEDGQRIAPECWASMGYWNEHLYNNTPVFAIDSVRDVAACMFHLAMQIEEFRAPQSSSQRTSLTTKAPKTVADFMTEAVWQKQFCPIKSSNYKVTSTYFTQPNETNNFTFPYKVLLQPTPQCASAKSLLVFIPSVLHQPEARFAIRDTWGSVANNANAHSNSKQTYDWPGNKPLGMEVTRVFVVGNPSPNAETPEKVDQSIVELRKEAETYNDIVWLDMDDSYQNLTRKNMLTLMWVQRNCKDVYYVAKVDQDIFVNVPLLTLFLRLRGRRSSIFGHFYFHSVVQRKGKWGVLVEDFPDKNYPNYASGNAYVISRDAVDQLVQAYPIYKPIPIEDAYITGILPEVANVTKMMISGFTGHSDHTPDFCDFVRDVRFTGNSFEPATFRDYWAQMKHNTDECQQTNRTTTETKTEKRIRQIQTKFHALKKG